MTRSSTPKAAHRPAGEDRPDAVGAFEGLILRPTGQGDDEFLTAVPRHQVFRSRGLSKHGSHLTQDQVTGIMTVVVVDLLEVVDVNEDHGQAHVAHRAEVPERADLVQEVAAIVEPGQVVPNGPFVHLVLKPGLACVELQEFEQRGGSKLDSRAIIDFHGRLAPHPLAIQERAVGAAQISQPGQPGRVDRDHGVPARDRIVRKGEGVVGRAAQAAALWASRSMVPGMPPRTTIR